MDNFKTQRGSHRKSSLAFPLKPTTKRGGFVKFIEESGTAEIFLEIFSRLFAENEKPEDPIRQIHKYFREKAPARQMTLDSIMETLQHDILQTASEIQEVKDRIRSSKNQRDSLSLSRSRTQMEEDVIGIGIAGTGKKNDDPDQRWHIKPDPFFRPTLNLATVLNWRQIDIKDTKEKGPDPKRSELGVPIPLPMTEGGSVSIPFFGDRDSELTLPRSSHNLGHDPYEFHVPKSTETSPQGSGSEEDEDEDEQDEGKPRDSAAEATAAIRTGANRTQYKIYDPKFFTEHIPIGFWKDDFSLDDQSDDSEDDQGAGPSQSNNQLIGHNYKFKVVEENSWLPERDAVNLGKLHRSSTEGEGKEDISAFSSVASLMAPPPVTSQLQTSTHEVPPKNALSHYEWIKKTYGPILLREMAPKQGEWKQKAAQ